MFLGRGDLNVSLDLGDLTSGLVDEEGLVDLVQKEFVVDLVVVEVLSEVLLSIRVSTGIRDGVFTVVPLDSVEDSVKVVTDNNVSSVFINIPVQVLVSGGGGIEVVVPVEDIDRLGDDLDLGNDVLVEEDWVTEVLLEGWDSPELLEED